MSPCHPSPVSHSPQSSPPCFFGNVCPPDCLLLAGGFSETYAALCDYNGFAFREEIQWVSRSLPRMQQEQGVTWGQDACLWLPHGAAWAGSRSFECPLLLGGLESKCRWERRALDQVVSQTMTQGEALEIWDLAGCPRRGESCWDPATPCPPFLWTLIPAHPSPHPHSHQPGVCCLLTIPCRKCPRLTNLSHQAGPCPLPAIREDFGVRQGTPQGLSSLQQHQGPEPSPGPSAEPDPRVHPSGKDVDNIYHSQDCREFNLLDFSHLESR